MKKSLAVIFILPAFASFAQNINTQKLDSFFNILDSSKKAMGSVAISKNGKLLYSKTIGFIDAEQKIKANAETKYRIGSITKMFTAVIVFQLIEEKKLTLETKLSRYFPQIKNATKITIAHMLGNRSGIYNYTDDSTIESWRHIEQTQKEMLQHIAAYPSLFEPGTKYEYSNSNFTLLTYIIEKITQKTYAENLQQRIVKKLALSNTYFGSKINSVKNEATSFNYSASRWQQYAPETVASVLSGAGGIEGTPADLNNFITALFAGKLISQKYVQLMQKIKDGYGMAMIKLPFYNKFAYGHTGGIDGFNSCTGYFKDDSICFSICNNGTNYNFNDILIGILSCSYNKPFKLPVFTQANNQTAQDLMKYIGVYSTPKFPLKITITTDSKTLTAQATGQSSFPLEYKGGSSFGFDMAGIELIFNTEKSEMTLNQSGASFILQKEK